MWRRRADVVTTMLARCMRVMMIPRQGLVRGGFLYPEYSVRLRFYGRRTLSLGTPGQSARALELALLTARRYDLDGGGGVAPPPPAPRPPRPRGQIPDADRSAR